MEALKIRLLVILLGLAVLCQPLLLTAQSKKNIVSVGFIGQTKKQVYEYWELRVPADALTTGYFEDSDEEFIEVGDLFYLFYQGRCVSFDCDYTGNYLTMIIANLNKNANLVYSKKRDAWVDKSGTKAWSIFQYPGNAFKLKCEKIGYVQKTGLSPKKVVDYTLDGVLFANDINFPIYRKPSEKSQIIYMSTSLGRVSYYGDVEGGWVSVSVGDMDGYAKRLHYVKSIAEIDTVRFPNHGIKKFNWSNWREK